MISPPLGSSYASSGRVSITGLRQTTLPVGNSGEFTVALPPGRYRLVGHTSRYIVNGLQGDCKSQFPAVSVQAHETATVILYCQEK